ncbi:MAG: NINE protein [Bacteroidota bacterium]
MKDKNTAAALAFFGGFIGLHKFYLEEQGAGLFYVFLTAVTVNVFRMPLAVLLGVIDCVMLLGMSDEDFDAKYNQKGERGSSSSKSREQRRRERRGGGNRYERYQERERQRRKAGGKTSRRASNRRVDTAPVAPRRSRNRSNTTNRRANPRVKAELEEGIRYFKDYEFDRAITAFESVLEKDPSNVAAHFNLGCSYSAEENKDKAFYHLDRAVALGFSDFERIRTHDSLAFLRIQDRFEEFAENGYRLVQDIPAPEATKGDPVAAEGTTTVEAGTNPNAPSGDLLEQLSRLAELREKGLLTEAEFASQKKRLLG